MKFKIKTDLHRGDAKVIQHLTPSAVRNPVDRLRVHDQRLVYDEVGNVLADDSAFVQHAVMFLLNVIDAAHPKLDTEAVLIDLAIHAHGTFSTSIAAPTIAYTSSRKTNSRSFASFVFSLSGSLRIDEMVLFEQLSLAESQLFALDGLGQGSCLFRLPIGGEDRGVNRSPAGTDLVPGQGGATDGGQGFGGPAALECCERRDDPVPEELGGFGHQCFGLGDVIGGRGTGEQPQIDEVRASLLGIWQDLEDTFKRFDEFAGSVGMVAQTPDHSQEACQTKFLMMPDVLVESDRQFGLAGHFHVAGSEANVCRLSTRRRLEQCLTPGGEGCCVTAGGQVVAERKRARRMGEVAGKGLRACRSLRPMTAVRRTHPTSR